MRNRFQQQAKSLADLQKHANYLARANESLRTQIAAYSAANRRIPQLEAEARRVPELEAEIRQLRDAIAIHHATSRRHP